MLHVRILVLLFIMLVARVGVAMKSGGINSGCPSWGCSPSGTFTLSSGIPATKGLVKWSVEVDHVNENLDVLSMQGCVSDQISIVCATQSGYISLEPVSGNHYWNYTTATPPFLPVMDSYGDVIGMDTKDLILIFRTGTMSHVVNITGLQPIFSPMIANESILLLTSSREDAAHQIVTYSTEGVLLGAISLSGTVNQVTGTFIPTSQPIIDGYRAYLVTQFAPHNLSESVAPGMHRLYAIDLWDNMTHALNIAWYFDMDKEESWFYEELLRSNGRKSDKERFGDDLPTIVTYFRNTIYINVPDWPSPVDSSPEQPHGGTLWAFRDDGDKADMVFKTDGVYGPMAVYDDTLSQRPHEEDDRTMWVLTRSPSAISGYSAKNGSLLGYIFVYDVANVSLVTSQLAITRQSKSSSNDVIIFGGFDTMGDASLVAIETDSVAHGKLMWKTILNERRQSNNDASWTVVGQIVNVAQTTLGASEATDWLVGLVALVTENGKDYTKLHVKGVY